MTEPERVRVFLDPEPLLEELRMWREDGHLMRDLSSAADVPYRTIRRYETGERAHVRLDCGDRLASALGVPMGFLWPDS